MQKHRVRGLGGEDLRGRKPRRARAPPRPKKVEERQRGYGCLRGVNPLECRYKAELWFGFVGKHQSGTVVRKSDRLRRWRKALKGEAQERYKLKQACQGQRRADTAERVAKPCVRDFLETGHVSKTLGGEPLGAKKGALTWENAVGHRSSSEVLLGWGLLK
jgi:hypothetical protein